MDNSNGLLKISVAVHFILTVWATTTKEFLPTSYIYMNLFVLIIGIFSIVHTESQDAVFMFMVLHIFSIIQDCIFLGIYQPIANRTFEESSLPASYRNDYRFSLGMCVLNLILKPVTAFLIVKVWKDRQGDPIVLPFNVPGFGSTGTSTPSGYEAFEPNNER